MLIKNSDDIALPNGSEGKLAITKTSLGHILTKSAYLLQNLKIMQKRFEKSKDSKGKDNVLEDFLNLTGCFSLLEILTFRDRTR